MYSLCIIIKGDYNIETLAGIESKLCKIQGTKMIKAKITGNKIVQQNDINWSKRILGKEALIHMKINTRIQDLIPRIIPDINPSYAELNGV